MALFPDKKNKNFQAKELISDTNEKDKNMISPVSSENHEDEVLIDDTLNGISRDPNIVLTNKETTLSSPQLNISNSNPALKAYASLPGPFPFSLGSPRHKPSSSNSSSSDHGPNAKGCGLPINPSPKKAHRNISFGPSHVSFNVGSQSNQSADIPPPHSPSGPNKHLVFGPSTPISHIPSNQPSLQQQQLNSMLGRRKTSPLVQNSLLQRFKNSNNQAGNAPNDQESAKGIEQTASLIKEYIKELDENNINRGNYVPDSGCASPDDVDAINNHQIDDHKNASQSNENSSSKNEKINDDKEKEKTDNRNISLEDKPVIKLYNILSKPSCLINIKEDLLNELINTVKHIMTISILNKIPTKYIYSDQVVLLRLTNWGEYQYVHKILSLILHHGNRKVVDESFINQEFAHLLFEFYNSPEAEERLMVDNIFHFLAESFQTFNRFIYHECFTRILNHIQNDQTSFYCVNPALSFLNNFLNTNSHVLVMNHNPDAHTDTHYSFMNSNQEGSAPESADNFDGNSVIPNHIANYVDLFKLYLLPLFTSNFLPAFYSTLSQICSQFYGLFDQDAPLISMNYILNHWPTTNSQKQTIFLTHINVILPFISSDSMQKIVVPIFHRLSLCLQCNNYKVTNSTLNLINDETFFSTFSSFATTIIPIIVPKLLGLDDFWCSDLNGKHVNVLQRFLALDPESYQNALFKYEDDKENQAKDKLNPKSGEEAKKWNMVVSAAKDSYKEINTEEYSKKINFMTST
ncbi:hypothetical protein M9Y10_028301 [Tritrichomonas musculus]|uniref:Uncharacterized protein n=1 Tax=Tritrichomonas musculus TaxID=1915356 RepID=A0ABR2KJZ9_9EUKA